MDLSPRLHVVATPTPQATPLRTYADLVRGRTEPPFGAHPRNPHPVAEAFPMIQGKEWDEFVADIRAHGQRDPIVLHRDGRIIDGRNRYAACLLIGVRPICAPEPYTGTDESIVEFVASKNIHRRQLSTEARAFIASSIANMKREDNLVAGPHRSGAVTETSNDVSENQRKPHSVPDPLKGNLVSQAEAAKALNVSVPTLQRARAIETHAPELKEKVLAGEMSLNGAAAVAIARSRGKAEPTRHAIHRKTHRRNQTDEVDRALIALESAARVIASIEIEAVNPARLPEWIKSLSAIREDIGQVVRRFKNVNAA